MDEDSLVAIGNISTLTELNLLGIRHEILTERSLRAIGRLQQLRQLDTKGFFATDAGLEGISHATNLVSLLFGGSEVTDDD